MRRYSKNYYNDPGCLEPVISIVIIVALLFAIMIGFNTCTAPEWNDGECPQCHEDYVLRSVYKGIRYYSCPKCGNEVSRYGEK